MVHSEPVDRVRSFYESRLGACEAGLAVLERGYRRFSWLRLALFGGCVLCLILAFWITPSLAVPLFWLAALFIALFLIAVGLHQRLVRRQRAARELSRINAEALARLDRAWDALPAAEPPAGLEVDPSAISTARDLILFGRGSLYQLLGAPGTARGARRLASWLLAPAAPDEILERQTAVRELAPLVDFRQELVWRARVAGKLDPDAFLAWAEGEPWLLNRRWLLWLSRILPVLLIAAITLDATGVLGGAVWPSLLLINLVVSLGFGERIHGYFDALAARHATLSAYEKPFAILAGAPFVAPRLRAIQQRAANGSGGAERAMRALSRLVELATLHHSQMTWIPIQALTLWDFHVLARLERWQVRQGRSARAWLEALGEIEALAALAGLAFDNPDWAFPEVGVQYGDVLTADDLGHPLLVREVRVGNDVTVGPSGSFLLVTGSNMSGKSTLLRAIGSNVVLAQAGAPVCARRMRMPPLELATSIVIEDSLVNGVSFFMAELKRLKEIVEAADRLRGGGGRLLYLLDEVLRGTNAVERQIAARRVIGHLLGAGAIGAVSTHDTGLATSDELAAAAIPVHFQETFGSTDDGPVMSFDYVLRPGLATTTNALKLLELVGLGEV